MGKYGVPTVTYMCLGLGEQEYAGVGARSTIVHAAQMQSSADKLAIEAAMEADHEHLANHAKMARWVGLRVQEEGIPKRLTYLENNCVENLFRSSGRLLENDGGKGKIPYAHRKLKYAYWLGAPGCSPGWGTIVVVRANR